MLTVDFSNGSLGIGPTPLKKVFVISAENGNKDHYFVNSVASTPIPEPSAAVLFCVGALLVGETLRRQALPR